MFCGFAAAQCGKACLTEGYYAILLRLSLQPARGVASRRKLRSGGSVRRSLTALGGGKAAKDQLTTGIERTRSMAMKTKPLSEQTALVTGGGTGMGRAFTQ